MKKLFAIFLFFSLSAHAQIEMYYTTLNPISSTVSYDTDAQAYITAVEGTGASLNSAQEIALNNFVLGLKSNSLWSSMVAVYPFMGGTAAAHKFNLMDPRDLDAAYRLVFNGTFTHSSTGADPNGSAGTFANTFLVPNSVLSLNSTHISYYSRESTTKINCAEIGAINNASTGALLLAPRFVNNDQYASANGLQVGPNADNISSQGYFILSRTASTGFTVYRNAASTRVYTSTSGTLNMGPLYAFGIASSNANPPANAYNSDRECAMITIGLGLTSGQVTILNTLVETFEDALSRGVQ